MFNKLNCPNFLIILNKIFLGRGISSLSEYIFFNFFFYFFNFFFFFFFYFFFFFFQKWKMEKKKLIFLNCFFGQRNKEWKIANLLLSSCTNCYLTLYFAIIWIPRYINELIELKRGLSWRIEFRLKSKIPQNTPT